MDEVVAKCPVRIAMEFAGWNTTNADVWVLVMSSLFSPRDTNLGGEFGDIFIVFKISPEFNLGAWFLLEYFANYGYGWSHVTPGSAADY